MASEQGTNHDGTAQKTLFLTPFKKNGQEIAGHEHAQPTAKILATSLWRTSMAKSYTGTNSHTQNGSKTHD